jgi:intracellular septation protein A
MKIHRPQKKEKTNMNKATLISGIILIVAGLFSILTYDANFGKFLIGVLLVIFGAVILIIAKVRGN